jgi:hypothetical protein
MCSHTVLGRGEKKEERNKEKALSFESLELNLAEGRSEGSISSLLLFSFRQSYLHLLQCKCRFTPREKGPAPRQGCTQQCKNANDHEEMMMRIPIGFWALNFWLHAVVDIFFFLFPRASEIGSALAFLLPFHLLHAPSAAPRDLSNVNQ